MIPNIFRWTALAFIFPHQFIEGDVQWQDFSLDEFQQRYEWEEDRWGGLLDIAQPAETTIETAAGDCEDYAIVLAGYLLSETDENVSLGFFAKGLTFHVTCITDDTVYSSGRIFDGTVEEYCQSTGYTKILERSV